MPWCPRCDEIFPEGTACPRCRARLVPAEAGRAHHGLQPVEGLPQLKVPRRYRRAFDRLSAPKAPPQRLLVIAVASLVFAVGFLFGRLGSQPASGPTVGLPSVDPLSRFDVDGSATYMIWSPGEHAATIVSHQLATGGLSARTGASAPAEDVKHTKVSALGSSVALVLSGDDGSFVLASPRRGAPLGWIPGAEAAWESQDVLLVRTDDGRLLRWSPDKSAVFDEVGDGYQRLMQTPSGVVAQTDGHIEVRSSVGSRRTIAVPDGSDLLATSPDGLRALIDDGRPKLWDGTTVTAIRAQAYEAMGGSFSTAGDRAAIALRSEDGRVAVGVVDAKGNIAIKPVPTHAGPCDSAPVWDARGQWVYISPGDGSIYAVEASGGRVEPLLVHSVGCGLAWFA